MDEKSLTDVKQDTSSKLQQTITKSTDNELFINTDSDSINSFLDFSIDETIQKQLNEINDKIKIIDAEIAATDETVVEVSETVNTIKDDLQDLKSDVETNTTNIATNTTRITGAEDSINNLGIAMTNNFSKFVGMVGYGVVGNLINVSNGVLSYYVTEDLNNPTGSIKTIDLGYKDEIKAVDNRVTSLGTYASTNIGKLQSNVAAGVVNQINAVNDGTLTYTACDTYTGSISSKTIDLGYKDSIDSITIKLDGIEEGANKTVVDSTLSSASTNPVQNKVVNSALSNKLDSTATAVSAQKLSTARTINNVSFDGSADVNIAGATAVCGSDSTSTAGWFKWADYIFSENYSDLNLTFIVEESYGTDVGIFTVRIRHDTSGTMNVYRNYCFTATSTNIAEHIKIIKNEKTVEFYVYSSGKYKRKNITVLSCSPRVESHVKKINLNAMTLYDSSSSTDLTNLNVISTSTFKGV